MTRRKKYKAKKRIDNARFHTVLATVIFIISLSLLGFFAYQYKSAIDKSHSISENNCKNDGFPETIAILIDHTGSINAIQKSSLEIRLRDIANSVKKNGNVKFFTVESVEEGGLVPTVSICNPGSGDDVSDLTGNKRLADRKFFEKFESVLDNHLMRILNSAEANSSPIMKSIQSVYVETFLGEKNKSDSKKLILVSDLLEHTDDFSLYRNDINFENFSKGYYWPTVKSNMEGLDVEILFLNRAGNLDLQTPLLKLFWQLYFLEQGAQSVKFTPVEG